MAPLASDISFERGYEYRMNKSSASAKSKYELGVGRQQRREAKTVQIILPIDAMNNVGGGVLSRD